MKNAFSAAMLSANVESYLGSGGTGNDAVRARLAAINSIWSLGEIGGPGAAADLLRFYKNSDNTLRINEVIGLGKTGGAGAAAFIKSVAASGKETETVRAAAFEMLEEMGQGVPAGGLVPSQSAGIADGDIIYAGGLLGDYMEWVSPDLPLGHTAIFAGVRAGNGRLYVLIGDCVPNFFKPGGVRNITAWKDFTHQFHYPYYGNMTTSPAPTAGQRAAIVALSAELGKKGYKYDITHLSQKGPVQFDCVGYSEYIYEAAGLDPTDESYESGLGWPLTPWEQYAGLVSNTAPTPPHILTIPFPSAPGIPAAAKNLEEGLFGSYAQPIETAGAIVPAPAD